MQANSETKKEFQFNCLSSFIIKVIAILTMTIDHVGVVMEMYSINYEVSDVFRAIGRIAMPLFCFMIVEGVIHTKSFGKYVLRMGIIGTLVLIAQIIMEYVMKMGVYQGGIFIDLILGALMIKSLMNKRIWVKLLAIIPIGIGVLSFICFSYEAMGGEIYAFPYYLRTQYGFISLLIILGFYLAYLLAPFFMKMFHMDPEIFKDTNVERLAINVVSVCLFVVIAVSYYLFGMWMTLNELGHFGAFWDYGQQNFMLISSAFVLLYSGLRGYNAKWFKYGQYLYYPLHILLIYGIFTLIIGG